MNLNDVIINIEQKEDLDARIEAYSEVISYLRALKNTPIYARTEVAWMSIINKELNDHMISLIEPKIKQLVDMVVLNVKIKEE